MVKPESLLPSLFLYYQVAQCSQKTYITVSSRLQVRSDKAKKQYKHQNQSHSQLPLVSISLKVSLNWSRDLGSVLFNPPGKDGVQLVDAVHHLPHIFSNDDDDDDNNNNKKKKNKSSDNDSNNKLWSW